MDKRIEDYLRYLRYERNYSPETVRSYRDDLCYFEDFVTSRRGTFDVTQFDIADVRAWMADMLQRGMKSRTVTRRFCALRRFYHYLRVLGLTDFNALELLRAPKVEKPLPVWLRDDEMEALLDADDYADDLEGVRDRMLLELFYQTGLRRSEVAGLHDSDIDLAARQLCVLGKGNKMRYVPMGEGLVRLIGRYIELRDAEVDRDDDSLVVSRKGRPLSGASIYGIVRARMLTLPRLAKHGPHVLRHTFATTMLGHGADLMTVKELMGHSSLAATEVYTHLTPQEILKN